MSGLDVNVANLPEPDIPTHNKHGKKHTKAELRELLNKRREGRKILSVLAQAPILIIDEAHMLNGPKTTRFQCRRILPKFVICLTGTPIQNSVDDLARLLHIVNPSRFEYDGFHKWFTDHKTDLVELEEEDENGKKVGQ